MAEDPQVSRHQTKPFTLDGEASFAWRELKPGTYRAWVRAGDKSSQPQTIEIRQREEILVRFALGGGGRIVAQVQDATGKAVDPATAVLVQVGEGGRDHPLGQFVTRAGVLDAGAIVPGRYRLQVTAAGFLPATSEPFDVREDSTTNAGTVVLRRLAYLQIEAPVDARGRAVGGPVQLYYREGEKAERPVIPQALTQGRLAVTPGRVTVRAESDEGRFEQVYDVPDGGVVPVKIVLR
jgi:hypothetical protein